LLITLGGVILDFELAPANVTDLAVGFELLSQHTDLHVLGDKAYIGASKATELWQDNRLRLQTLQRRNQKRQAAPEVKRLFNAVRQTLRQSTANSVSSSTLRRTMPIRFGVCAPDSTAS
jgi:hypothetical protein